MNTRSKKRSSILKRSSMSSSENSSPTTEISTTTSTTSTKTSKRISFSRRLSVKEFASGQDCITIWNNSYERSAEHCNTVGIPDETATESDNTVKTVSELPILTGPNKENIIVSEMSSISANVSMSTTIQMDAVAMKMNNLMYKSPGKIIYKEHEIENDSMEIEEIDQVSNPVESRKTILDGEMSLMPDNNETKTTLIASNTEDDMQESDISIELFTGEIKQNPPGINRKTVLFEKEELEISPRPKTRTTTFDMSMDCNTGQENAKNALKRNRRQTKVELSEMEISSLNDTPTGPAKKDRRETVYDSAAIDVTLNIHEKSKNNRRTIVQPSDMNETLTQPSSINVEQNRHGSSLARKTIVFSNETLEEEVVDDKIKKNTKKRGTLLFNNDEMDTEITVGPTDKSKRSNLSLTLKSRQKPSLNAIEPAIITQKQFKPKRESVYTVQDMNETLNNQPPETPSNKENINYLSRRTNHYENDQTLLEENKIEYANNGSMLPQEFVEAADDMDETLVNSENAIKDHHPIQRKTQYFENEQMAIESVKGQKSNRLTNVVSKNMDVSFSAASTKRMSIVKCSPAISKIKERVGKNSSTRQSIYSPQNMNETLTDKPEPMKNIGCSTVKNNPTKNSLKRIYRQSNVNELSMQVSSIHLTPRSNNPIKKDRRETILFKEEPGVQSDIDITLQNLSYESKMNLSSRVSSDMDITKIPEVKELNSLQQNNSSKVQTPSKIPIRQTQARGSISFGTPTTREKSSRSVLRDLSAPKIKRLTVYDQSMQIETEEQETVEKVSNENIAINVNESEITLEEIPTTSENMSYVKNSEIEQCVEETKNKVLNETKNIELELTPDMLRRQTIMQQRRTYNRSIAEIAELSVKRFQDLQKTIQNNDLLTKESDIDIALDSTLTEHVVSKNDTIYQPCSYANITLENFGTPEISRKSKTLEESCVCSDTTLTGNSCSVSTLEGLSPNVSVRLSFANEIFEQIRERVMRQTSSYCKNCKCSIRLHTTQSNPNENVLGSLIDWSRFPKVPYNMPAVDEMEKQFLIDCTKLETNDSVLQPRPEMPSVSSLLENLRQSITESLNQDSVASLEERCPCPYPASKSFVYLMKNKLACDASSWKVIRSMHAPIGIIQLRNDKMKSVLLHLRIEPKSLQEKNIFEFESIKFIQNIVHPLSSPFTFVVFQRFTKEFSLEASLRHLCSNSNSLFDFLKQIDERISQIYANVGQLFAILKEHKVTVYMDNLSLKASTTIVDDETQVIRLVMNLADPENFSANDISTYPEDLSLKHRSNRFNLKGVEFLEHFLSNIKTIVLNK